MVDAHAHLHIRVDCVGEGVHAIFGGSEDTWEGRQTAGNHIRFDFKLQGQKVLLLQLCVFPTQGWVISAAIIKSDGGVGDGHIGIERTKASLIRSRGLYSS